MHQKKLARHQETLHAASSGHNEHGTSSGARKLLLIAMPLVLALSGCLGDGAHEYPAADLSQPPDSAPIAPPSSTTPLPTPTPTPLPTPDPTPTPTPTPPPTAALTATLSWAANPDPDLAGYRIYYGTVSGKYLQARGQGVATRTTAHTVDNLQAATRYYFAITAVDSNGNESGFSQEVTKQTQ